LPEFAAAEGACRRSEKGGKHSEGGDDGAGSVDLAVVDNLTIDVLNEKMRQVDELRRKEPLRQRIIASVAIGLQVMAEGRMASGSLG
jgi:hypothetical protein